MTMINLNQPVFLEACRPEFIQGFIEDGYSIEAIPFDAFYYHATLHAINDEIWACLAAMVVSFPEHERNEIIKLLESRVRGNAE